MESEAVLEHRSIGSDRSPASEDISVVTGSSDEAGGREEARRGGDTHQDGEGMRGGEREGERRQAVIRSVDSGLGRDEWVAVQRKKKSNRQEGKVRVCVCVCECGCGCD